MESALGLTRYRVTVEALEPLALPAYLGSTLRGAFGHAFRMLACPARSGETCPIPASCPYHLVFETASPPDATALRTHEEIPRPFVIAAPPAGARAYPGRERGGLRPHAGGPQDAQGFRRGLGAFVIEGGRLSIVTPEDLIISNLEWARQTRLEVQLADVRNVLASVPGLDDAYLTHWTGRLGLEALYREARG